MREKRNLIWLSLFVIVIAFVLLICTKNDTVRNLSIGIIGSAFVSLVLVISEYFTQKHATLNEIYLQLVAIQKLFVEKYRFVKKGKPYEEKAIDNCLDIISPVFFSRNSLHVIKAHIDDEIAVIADTDSFQSLSSLYPDKPTEPGQLQGEDAAKAILKSRIFLIINNIDVIIEVVKNNRRIRIDQIFRQLSFFSDSCLQLRASLCRKAGWLERERKLLEKTLLHKLEKELWDPIIGMFAAFEQFTPGMFGPFRDGYDTISLKSLQRSFFYMEDAAYKHPSYKEKPYEEVPPYLQFLGGFTKNLQNLEDKVFFRKRKKK